MRILSVCLMVLGVAVGSVAQQFAAERGASGSAGAAAARAATERVNVNTAGTEELTSITGIGPALAQRIIDYRREHGPFKTVDDLTAVKGIGPKLLAKIKERISVGEK